MDLVLKQQCLQQHVVVYLIRVLVHGLVGGLVVSSTGPSYRGQKLILPSRFVVQVLLNLVK